MSVKFEKKSVFPFLETAASRVKRDFEEYALFKRYDAGEVICWEGDECNYFYVIITGSVRVFKTGDNGREITLYKITENDSCILTTFSILNRSPFSATSIAENDAIVVAIPRAVFREWINEYEEWRNYVFGLMSGHLTGILGKIESMAFQRLDERIAAFLLQSTPKNQRTIKITHSDIARELGTVREVVSRILKNFEREKLVSLSRGRITIINNRELSRCQGAYSMVG